MEINIKFKNINILITEDDIICQSKINEYDVNEIIRLLKSQIQVLKLYKKGITMGKKNILDNVDENGYYTMFKTSCSGDDESDL